MKIILFNFFIHMEGWENGMIITICQPLFSTVYNNSAKGVYKSEIRRFFRIRWWWWVLYNYGRKKKKKKEGGDLKGSEQQQQQQPPFLSNKTATKKTFNRVVVVGTQWKHARKRGKRGRGMAFYPYHVNRVSVAQHTHICTIPYFVILPGGYICPQCKPHWNMKMQIYVPSSI